MIAQEDAAAFFKDKQLKLVVGSAAGDGYDLNARMLARHWANHIPGKPQIVIQNQPGAASVPMTNALYNGAPRDGGRPSSNSPTHFKGAGGSIAVYAVEALPGPEQKP